MRDLMRKSDGQQYMGRIQGTGSTCRAAGTADSLIVKHDQHGLTLDELEGEVCVVRKTVLTPAVDACVWDLCHNAVHQVVAQLTLIFDALFHVCSSNLCCLAKTYDTWNILGTCTAFALLRAAMDEGTDLHTGADVKETDSLRSVDLVAAGTHHVDVKIIYVDRHMSVCLNRVGVEQNAMLLRDLANLFDRLDG